MHLRRLIREDLAFVAGIPFRLSDPAWVHRRASELDLGRHAEWQEFRCMLWNRQLHALDLRAL